MSRTPQVTSPAAALVPARLHGHVRLEDVRTEYDGVEVLHGVSLSVSPGEYVAVVGPSGAGKSTLVSLLTRAQDPVGGTVSLDGYPLQALDLGLLRASVSVLHQEALLLTGTVAENIRMGRQDATDAQVEAAARAAGAHGFITDLPQGYDTVVGERGGTLSGGQRQRVGIARALLRSAPVVVLDEATTGLDPHSASLVLDAVDRLVRGRTTIAVTHDAEVAVRATRVVWLEEGRILMDGTPQELAATSPRFRTWLDSRRAASLAGGGVS